MDINDHAEAIRRWYDAHRDDAVSKAPHADELLIHADALADAADAEDEAVRSAGIRALFAGVVEPLNDGFSTAGRAVYAQVFPRVIWRVATRCEALRDVLAAQGITSEAALRDRYQRVRQGTHTAPMTAKRIGILSRVTIGADILLTSIVLQRLQQQFPKAELCLIGDAKLAPLLGDLANVTVRGISYGRRGALRERLLSWTAVLAATADCDMIVAPDSRLDQLGILPVCDEQRYFLWENTLPIGQAHSLADCLDDWLVETFPLVWGRRCTPILGLDAATRQAAEQWTLLAARQPLCAVKLDHGGNAAKSLPRAHEVAILHALQQRGWRIVLDRGFGSEELANSDALLHEAGLAGFDCDDSGKGFGIPIDQLHSASIPETAVIRFHGSIAGWAAAVTACGHAISYDSVGHHLAAAAGVPVTVAFTGYDHDDFSTAWQPRGKAAITLVRIRTADKASDATLQRVIAALPQAPR